MKKEKKEKKEKKNDNDDNHKILQKKYINTMKEENNDIIPSPFYKRYEEKEEYKKVLQEYYNKYFQHGYICFSVNVEMELNSKGMWKKDIKYPNGWINLTKDNTFFSNKLNGLSILTGEKSNIIVLDIDNIESWNKFLKDNNKEEPKTIKIKSGNGGYHLYFQYNELLKNVPNIKNIFGDEYRGIDIRTNGGNIIAPPTTYFNKKINNFSSYKYEGKNLFEENPSEMEEWIKIKLLDLYKPKKEKIKYIVNDKDQKNIFKVKQIDITENQKKILEKGIEMLGIKTRSNMNSWLFVGSILYIYKFGVEHWDEWSKKGENYYGKNDPRGCYARWDKLPNRIDRQLDYIFLYRNLIGYEGEEKQEQFRNLICSDEEWKKGLEEYEKKNITYNDLFVDKKHEFSFKKHTINSKYLLDKDAKIQETEINDDDVDRLINLICDHLVNNNKLLLLGSSMGTGKTELLKRIFEKLFEIYGIKIRILFLTYRQSLAMDINSNFESYEFTNYLDIKDKKKIGKSRNLSYLDDKIICSIESLTNIRQEGTIFDFNTTFDIVILDEINSTTRHFKSDTIRGEKQDTFMSVLDYCQKAKKVIALDADTNDRVFNFCEAIDNEFTFIENEFKTPINVHIYYSKEEYEKLFLEKMKDGKIYMCCCNSDSVHLYEKIVKDTYKDKNTKKIFGKMNTEEKKDIQKDFIGNLLKYDFVATTSVNEAGVNFDPKDKDGNSIIHFTDIFGVLGDRVCPNQFIQMLKRVRHHENKDNIYILANGVSKGKNFICFDDLLNDPKYSIYDDFYKNNENYEYYKRNIILNDVEDENRKRNYIGTLCLILKQKGCSVIHHQKEKGDRSKHDKSFYDIEKTLYANYTFDEIDKIINKNNRTENENYMIENYLYKLHFHFNDEENEKLSEELKEHKKKLYVLKEEGENLQKEKNKLLNEMEKTIDEEEKQKLNKQEDEYEEAETETKKKKKEKIKKPKESEAIKNIKEEIKSNEARIKKNKKEIDKLRNMENYPNTKLCKMFFDFIKLNGKSNIKNFWAVFDKNNILLEYDDDNKKWTKNKKKIEIEHMDYHEKILAILEFVDKLNIDKDSLLEDGYSRELNYENLKNMFNNKELSIFTNKKINQIFKTVDDIDGINKNKNNDKKANNKEDEKDSDEENEDEDEDEDGEGYKKNRREINKFLSSLLKNVGLDIIAKREPDGKRLRKYYIIPIYAFKESILRMIKKNAYKKILDEKKYLEKYVEEIKYDVFDVFNIKPKNTI
jgi:hypothetical protein